MTAQSDPSQNDNPYVIDAESAIEMARLVHQDLLVTKCMGGLFSERPDFANIHRVLDIACGPGGWALEVAFAHPDIEVVGIDIGRVMVEYATAQAQVQGLDNARFIVMDALKPLDFRDNSFDLVNARTLGGFMSPSAWPAFVEECVRITDTEGLVRLTEADDFGTTSSPAFEKLWGMCLRAFQLAGRTFFPDGRNLGTTPRLRKLLHDAGCQKIQSTAHVLDYSAGAEAYESTYQDWKVAFKLIQPFLIRMGITTQEEADQLYQQVLAEILSPDFCGVAYSLSVCGEKP